jgi:hypothetical protein
MIPVGAPDLKDTIIVKALPLLHLPNNCYRSNG